jgi:hypothetical protein
MNNLKERLGNIAQYECDHARHEILKALCDQSLPDEDRALLVYFNGFLDRMDCKNNPERKREIIKCIRDKIVFIKNPNGTITRIMNHNLNDNEQ